LSTDAIVILEEDHRRIKDLFWQFEAAVAAFDAPAPALAALTRLHDEIATRRKGSLLNKILEELTVHTYIENESMYAQVRRLAPELEADVLESYEEHHVADVLCTELAAMPTSAERFDAKVKVLIENVTHHIDEEERDWFPKVRQALSQSQLNEIGREMLKLKKEGPWWPARPSALKRALDAVIR